MNKQTVITGAAGFIGSVLASDLTAAGHQLVLVDDFDRPAKIRNHDRFPNAIKIDRKGFFRWFNENADSVAQVIHIGARTDTTATDIDVFNKLNLFYTQSVWRMCTEFNIPLVYASSAATYGLGEFGYTDDHEVVEAVSYTHLTLPTIYSV